MIKEKKAQLMKHVTSLVIAALGIAILVVGIVLLYKAWVNQDAENAKKALNLIEAKIEALEEGESTTFPLRGPEGWVLVGWDKDASPAPEKCYFKGCLCACPLKENLVGKDTLVNNCQEKGICRLLNIREIRTNELYLVNNVPGGSSPYITFQKNLIEIHLTKKAERIEFIYDSGRRTYTTGENVPIGG